MDKETYERQKAFATEKKPSMLRRCVGHDYTERQIYMVTMVTEGRRALFGRVTGSSDAPIVELTELGRRVEHHFWDIGRRVPEISVVALQMMPDHLHGILFVREKMKKTLGQVIAGFKSGCNKDYRELVMGRQSVVAMPQQTEQKARQTEQEARQTEQEARQTEQEAKQTEQEARQAEQEARQTEQEEKLTGLRRPPREAYDRNHGLLFASGYNDKWLLRNGQLDVWLNYLKDNPRRLLMKHEHPDLFRVQRGLTISGHSFSAIGNRFLLDRPYKLQVQCSRSMTEEEIQIRVSQYLLAAAQGAVLVSPSISKGEKAVMRAAFDKGFPLIYLQENGFTDLAKPSGQRMEACASGQLLILAPWKHHNERTVILRSQCLTLNEWAKRI